ncbi:MAG: LuxR C-terminal-related transcriptional regulator [Pseudomonadota bacterium]
MLQSRIVSWVWLAIGVLSISVALTALEHWVDTRGSAVPDFALEVMDRTLMLGAAVGAAFSLLHIGRLRDHTEKLSSDIERAAAEGQSWRAERQRFLDGLSQAIKQQFDEWGLTPAEADVAGLLLKGASLKEIATLRNRSEITVRQQASTIYRKSGLTSRVELSAYFLEDLFNFSETELERVNKSAS